MQAAPELKPLGVGDIVDRVFSIYRARFVPLIAIASIPYLLLVLSIVGITFAFGGAVIAVLSAAIEPRAAGLGRLEGLVSQPGVILQLLVWFVLVIVISLAVGLVQSAALVAAVAARYMGRDTTVGEALRSGLRASPRLLVMGLIASLAIAGLWMALAIFMGVFSQWWSIALGLLAGFVGMTYIAASWMVSPPVAILEGAGPVTALRRSWYLSGGHRWRILGLILLLLILQGVLSSLLSFVLIASLVADRGVQVALQQAVNLLASIAWAPIYWGTFAILYYDLRVRKEALDLQLAVEALPRETSS